MTDDFDRTERDIAETETAWGYRLTRLETLVLILILIAVLGFFQIMFPLLLGFLFLTGWAVYLWRFLSLWTFTVPQFLWFCGLLLAVALVVHLLLNGLYRRFQSTRVDHLQTAATTKWEKRWTASLLVLVLSLAGFSFALLGLKHTVQELVTTNERLLLVHKGRGRYRRNETRYHLKQLGLAMHNYHNMMSRFPPGGIFDRAGQLQHSWATQLLPLLDQAYLYNQINFEQPWTATDNRPHFENRLPVLQNPRLNYDYQPGDLRRDDAHRLKPAHYAANSHVFNVNSAPKIQEIRDGTSNTLLAGEVNSQIKAWGDPTNFRDPTRGINADPQGFGSPSTGGAYFLLGDGSVRFINENIDPAILKALATPDGGEPVGEY